MIFPPVHANYGVIQASAPCPSPYLVRHRVDNRRRSSASASFRNQNPEPKQKWRGTSNFGEIIIRKVHMRGQSEKCAWHASFRCAATCKEREGGQRTRCPFVMISTNVKYAPTSKPNPDDHVLIYIIASMAYTRFEVFPFRLSLAPLLPFFPGQLLRRLLRVCEQRTSGGSCQNGWHITTPPESTKLWCMMTIALTARGKFSIRSSRPGSSSITRTNSERES